MNPASPAALFLLLGAKPPSYGYEALRAGDMSPEGALFLAGGIIPRCWMTMRALALQNAVRGRVSRCPPGDEVAGLQNGAG